MRHEPNPDRSGAVEGSTELVCPGSSRVAAFGFVGGVLGVTNFGYTHTFLP